MRFFTIVALLIAVAIVLFSLQNAAVVTLSFLSFHYSGSLALILVAVFSLGLLAGILISVPPLFRKSSELRAQRRRIKQLEEDLAGRTTSTPADPAKSDGH